MDGTNKSRKEDLRVRRTKKALTEVFRELLEEKKFEEITVNELCNRAGIRRATFYKHFDDKYVFLAFVVRSLRDDFDRHVWAKKKPGTTSEYYNAYLKELVAFINYYDKTFMGIIESSISHHLINIMMAENYKDTKERLDRSVEDGMKLPASTETVAAMLTGGVGQVLIAWIKDGKRMPVDTLFSEISSIIDKIQNGK